MRDDAHRRTEEELNVGAAEPDEIVIDLSWVYVAPFIPIEKYHREEKEERQPNTPPSHYGDFVKPFPESFSSIK